MAQKNNLSGKIRMLCIIANDADIVNNRYVCPGRNYKVREEDAVAWVNEHLPAANVVWAFGAGTAPECRFGPTYASVCEASLRLVVPAAQILCNTTMRSYWGTYEEMAWIVEEVERKHYSSAIEFIFFTQRQHMERVKLVWRLFYQAKWGPARFVITSHAPGCELPESAELKKRLGYSAMRYSCGLLRPKHLRQDWVQRYLE